MNKKMRSMKRGLSKRGIKTRKVKGLKGRKVNSFKSGKNINLVGGAVKTFPLVVTLRVQENWEHHYFLIIFDTDGLDTDNGETERSNMLNSFQINHDESKYGTDTRKVQRGLDIPGKTILDTMYDALANSEDGVSEDKLAYYDGVLYDLRGDIYQKFDVSCKYDKGRQIF